MPELEIEQGSFRDRNGRIYYIGTEIFRGLSIKALDDWTTLSSSAFFARNIAKNKIIPTEFVDSPSNDAIEMIASQWAGILKHQRIPFISYPYEWSFSMLKDAALLQLDLLLEALGEDMILKDSSAYNVQWQGTVPVFIDIPSFEKLDSGEPWIGYRQFCQLFLFPLLLQAYKDIPFQPWLRGNIDGIEPEHANNIISFRDLFRPGIFTNVYLQAKMSKKHGNTTRLVKSELKNAGFNKKLIEANVKRLHKLVSKLEWKRDKTEWSDYTNFHNYTDDDLERKVKFVREVASTKQWKLAWDIGCNTGTFSRIVSEYSDSVVAMDTDHLAIDNLYQALKSENNHKIIPLISNVADSSPNLGWRGSERKSLENRSKPELTLCLALIHHVVISANIPMVEFIQWLASLETSLIIEFVTKDDPMVKILLRNKDDQYADYELQYFEKSLQENFDVQRREILQSGTRILFHAVPKPR